MFKGPVEIQLRQEYDSGSHLVSSNQPSATSGEPLAKSTAFGANWIIAIFQEKNAFSPNYTLPLILLLTALGGLIIAGVLPFCGFK